ncbi:hypothetical protein ACHAXR_001677 [Thalassiosira sp. AJA248-18]
MNDQINEKKRKSVESSDEKTRRGKTGRNEELAMSAESITDAAAHLHSLLQSKEKELKEREADFTRRVNLFDSENPTMGSDTDIIQLNVGGSTNIAVLRRTLTQFEDSMLAAKFSGRWDDSLEKDRDDNIFVDQNPADFLILVNYLRLRMNNRSRQVPVKYLPKPTYSFCSMLEYYNLMPGMYPQNWISSSGSFSCEEKAYGTVLLSAKKNADADSDVSASVLHDFGGFASAGVSEFTVEFEKGAKGAVGWLGCVNMGAFSHTSLDQTVENSIFLNITERKIFGPAQILEENMKIDHMESPTKVTCKNDGHGKYSIEVVDACPPGGVAATLEKSSGKYFVFPMISFSGNVTVSGFKYAIDDL